MMDYGMQSHRLPHASRAQLTEETTAATGRAQERVHCHPEATWVLDRSAAPPISFRNVPLLTPVPRPPHHGVFQSISAVKTLFEDWKRRHGEQYAQAYCTLTLPDLLAPFVRLEVSEEDKHR